MKRIVAAFKGKLEEMKTERNIKRISRSIDTAKDNALDKIEELEAQKADLVENLPNYTDFNEFVQKLSDLIDEQQEQKRTITRLDEIKTYLEEDIVIKEDSKKS